MKAVGDSTPNKKLKFWQISLAAIAVIGLIGFLAGSKMTSLSRDGDETKTSLVDSDLANIWDRSWVPKNFDIFTDDSNVAWRWGTRAETNCSYSTSSCWSVIVVTREGCPSGIYAEIAVFDNSGTQIDYTNEVTTRVLPRTKVKLTFDTFNEYAETARVSEIFCR